MAEALDQIAQAEGFNTWSLLQPKVKAFTPKTKEDLLNYLHHGDLLLIGAKPGLDKTTLTLQKGTIAEGSLIAVDYLQLLDQNRSKQSLQKQIEDLKAYAKEKQCIVIFISQIDRAFDEEEQVKPNMGDVRLPNPLDMSLFNKSIFVQNGQIYT